MRSSSRSNISSRIGCNRYSMDGDALKRYRGVVRPVTLTLSAYLLARVFAWNWRTQITFGLVMYVMLPVVELALGRADFGAVLRGRLLPPKLFLLGIAGVAFTFIYELANLHWHYHASLADAKGYDKSFFGFADVGLAEPFVEELFFQVGLQTALERFGSIISIALTATAFVAMHVMTGNDFTASAITHGPSAILLALGWWRYRSLGLCLLVHSGYNIVFILATP